MISEVLEKSNLSVVDDIGVVYIGENYVYRAINSIYIADVKDLLESGLIQELTSKGLFPKTEISNKRIKGHELVLQHEKISRVIYPFEWSPEMLRKAALCVLDVNQCANKYGYELKDSHPFNVLFKYNKPMYIDFGSIVKYRSINGWLAKKEFIDWYVNILLLIENGFLSLYKNAYYRTGLNGLEASRINNKFYQLIGKKITAKIEKFLDYYQNGSIVSNSSIEIKFNNYIIRRIIKFFLWSNILPFRKNSMDYLRTKIKRISLLHKSRWENYHSDANYLDKNGNVKLPSRMEWVVEQVSSLPVKTVTELAGNEGVLSRCISKLPNIEEVICTDYDENAIDSLLFSLKDEKIYVGCFDFIGEIYEQICPDRFNRLQSDLVIALAVTHHLILTQGYSIDYIFSTISSFTKKYIIIEFMPLGLWDGNYSPEIPHWYTEEWFTRNMEKFYKIIKREQIADNRVAFIGELLDIQKCI